MTPSHTHTHTCVCVYPARVSRFSGLPGIEEKWLLSIAAVYVGMPFFSRCFGIWQFQ